MHTSPMDGVHAKFVGGDTILQAVSYFDLPNSIDRFFHFQLAKLRVQALL
jgi:hypothetical protein